MLGRVCSTRAGIVLAALLACMVPAVAQTSAADKIADKFSSDSAAAQRKAEEQRKKDAEVKAMEALREQARRRAEDALKAERARELKAQAPQPQKPADTAPAEGVDPKMAEELEMLARARREEEERQKAEHAQSEAEARRAIEKIIAERAAPAGEADDDEARAKIIVAARRTHARSTERIAAQEREVAEAQARAKFLADARRTHARSTERIAAAERAEADASATTAALPAPVQSPQPEQPAPPSVASRGLSPALAEPLGARVTVLLIMEPGNRGIRRHNKSADPLLCVDEGCYVSTGADSPARFMPGRQALGLANTWGGRAGACRNQLGCVFRGVAVPELPLLVQPVDMRVLKHDRRHMAAVTTDSKCRLDAGRLTCARGIVEDDYVMWVIPERLADAAGPAALDAAVHAGLTGPQSALVGGR